MQYFELHITLNETEMSPKIETYSLFCLRHFDNDFVNELLLGV